MDIGGPRYAHRILNEGLMKDELVATQCFLSAHMEGSTRGVGLGINWAVIDYNTK
jgi:hypothetical protein